MRRRGLFTTVAWPEGIYQVHIYQDTPYEEAENHINVMHMQILCISQTVTFTMANV